VFVKLWIMFTERLARASRAYKAVASLQNIARRGQGEYLRHRDCQSFSQADHNLLLVALGGHQHPAARYAAIANEAVGSRGPA
jgi:hypothetical protein